MTPGWLSNAGQICMAPDYLLLPNGSVNDFVAAYRQEVGGLYPDIASNSNYTWIVNDRHYARLSNFAQRYDGTHADTRAPC